MDGWVELYVASCLPVDDLDGGRAGSLARWLVAGGWLLLVACWSQERMDGCVQEEDGLVVGRLRQMLDVKCLDANGIGFCR